MHGSSVQVEHLLADNDGLATSTSLLNATTELERKLTARAAQEFLKVLIEQKWLEQVVSLHVTLSCINSCQVSQSGQDNPGIEAHVRSVPVDTNSINVQKVLYL